MAPSVILLFGSSGCGKSTIANMLYQEDLRGDERWGENTFKVGSDARGVTTLCHDAANDQFHVYDTVGIGEGRNGSVGEEDAKAAIKEYLRRVRTSFHHICFVFKGPRITEVDTLMFAAFQKLFEGGERNFVVVCTHVAANYADKNRSALQQEFPGVPVIAVDFPWRDDDEEEAIHNKKKRMASKKRLIDGLHVLNRMPVEPVICREDDRALSRRAAQLVEIVRKLLAMGVHAVAGNCSVM